MARGQTNCGTYVWWLAGRRVTLHTRYFLFIWPQCVTSTFKPVWKQTRKNGYTLMWRSSDIFQPTAISNVLISLSLVGCDCTRLFLQCHFQNCNKDICWQGSQLCAGCFSSLQFPLYTFVTTRLKTQTKRRIESAYKGQRKCAVETPQSDSNLKNAIHSCMIIWWFFVHLQYEKWGRQRLELLGIAIFLAYKNSELWITVMNTCVNLTDIFSNLRQPSCCSKRQKHNCYPQVKDKCTVSVVVIQHD